MSAEGGGRASSYYAVDRLEGRHAVLLGDDGRAHSVRRAQLPRPLEEGVVFRVPVDEHGHPRWAAAEADPAERERRLAEAARRLAELRKRDPGGDVVL